MAHIYVDGASIGNPGKVGVGYAIYENEGCIKEGSVYLGIQTNNFAEYMALIFALIEGQSLNLSKYTVFSDSQLLCEQIKGNYKVKNNNIYPLYILAKTLIAQCPHFTITHIDREKNTHADALSKKAAGFLI